MVEDDGVEVPAVVVLDEVLSGVEAPAGSQPHALVLQQSRSGRTAPEQREDRSQGCTHGPWLRSLTPEGGPSTHWTSGPQAWRASV